MSEPTTGEPGEPTAAEDVVEVEVDDVEEAGGSREAMRYRRRLREAEAQRDALSARLGAMQRAEAQRLAAGALADPADLWRDGLSLAQLLDDDGALDPGKVVEAARAIADAHPHWATPRAGASSRRPVRSGVAGEAERPALRSWGEVLGGGRGVA